MTKKAERIIEAHTKIVEDFIEFYMSKLKPELAKKMVWIMSDVIEGGKPFIEDGVKKRMVVRASRHATFNPPVITFFVEAIVNSQLQMITNDIKAIIRHEVAHLFTDNEEEAGQKEKNWDIFIK